MAKFDYTFQQKQVLNDSSKNLLVSASAGSGKTATVIQKIFNLLTNGVDLQEMLVITFTEAASMEMKIRLKDKLYKESDGSNKYLSQLEKLPTSDISTLHSFCSKMLRKYFYKLDLNANFIVLDENDSRFLKSTALEKTINFYSQNMDTDFIKLSSIFGGGRNFIKLKSNILSYYDFLCAVEDKQKYKLSLSKLCYNTDINKSKQGEILNDYLLSTIYYITSALDEYLTSAQMANASYFVEFISQAKAKLLAINYKSKFLENRQALLNIDLPKITLKKLSFEDNSFKEEFKTFYADALKLIADLKDIVCKDCLEENLKQDLLVASSVIDKFQEVEQFFEDNYTLLKQNRNALDFADLEEKFLCLLSNKEVCETISKTYKYIFVDEYQDINSVQELILSQLTANNMIMVGDIKQSIYGFRNSSPNIFVSKSLNYSANNKAGTLITLNENFRSNPKILNFVNSIFNKCMSVPFGGVDYKESGQLEGKTEYKKVFDFPEIQLNVIDTKSNNEENLEETFNYPYSVLEDKNIYAKKLTTARKEAMVVANNILNLVGKEIYVPSTDSTKKITFGDIAILCRGNEFLKEVAKVLLEYNIPIATNTADNIYKNKDVAMLVSLLKVINNFHDDTSLSVVMTSIFGGFSFNDLAVIRKQFNEEEFFYQAVKNFALSTEDNCLKVKINNFISFINDLRQRLLYLSIFDLLNYLDNKFSFLLHLKSLPDGANRCQIVKNFINSFEQTEYNYDLNKYLNYVNNYAEDAKFSTTLNISQDSVKLGTIHSSKGLEYPIVFLIGCGKSFSSLTFREEILKDKDFGLGINTYNLTSFEKKDNLARNAITLSLKKQEKAEELRLLYVALTRAKNHLIIVGHCNIEKVSKVNTFKDAESSNSFIMWILSGLTNLGFANLKANKASFVDKNNNFEVDVNVFLDSDFVVNTNKIPQLNFDNLNKKIVDGLINSFNFQFEKNSNLALKNTVSSMLQEYSEGGESYNYEPQKLLATESKKQDIDATRLGTIYHKIMQKIDFKLPEQNLNEQIKNIVNSIKIDEKYLPYISEQKLTKAIKIIKQFNPILVEREKPFLSYLPYNFIFKNSLLTDKIVIQGVADLLIKTPEKTILIDYKTTKVKTPDQLVDKYKIQLKLYQICLEKALNIRIDESYVYSFWLDKLVKIN